MFGLVVYPTQKNKLPVLNTECLQGYVLRIAIA